MSDIDLIPSSYRQVQKLRYWLKVFLLVFISLFICTGALKIVLDKKLHTESEAIKQLKINQSALVKRRAEIDQLQSDYSYLNKRMNILESLRGGPPVKEVFLAIDRALNGKVWFLDWQFLRAGEYVPVQPEPVKTGYFIMIPEESAEGESRAWQLATHMKIRARASNHTALADFVLRLNSERIIDEVKIISTRILNTISNDAVDFELAIIVGAPQETS